MAPVIWKFGEIREEIRVYSLNPNNDIFNDYRLKFLINNRQIKLDYLYTSNSSKLFSFLFGNLICKYGLNTHKYLLTNIIFVYVRWFISKIFRFLLYRIFRINISHVISKIYDFDWVEDILIKNKPSILIFDHASHPKLYNVGSILKVAKKMKIPTIDIPHGIPLFVEHPHQWDKAKKNLVAFKKDHTVLHHKWWKKELIEFGLDPKNTPILGSPRFCKDWVKIINEILPYDDSLNNMNNEKLKVVYMEMGGTNDANAEIIEDTIKRISELDFINLIIKPQTRSNRLLLRENPDNIYIARNENSVNLVKWADVVLVLFSSIMIEALIQKKTYIYPKYMHDGEMIYEEYGACWTVNSYKELEMALLKKYKKRNYQPYSNDNVNQFLNEAIFNGFVQKDILNNYVDYISDIAKY